MAPNQLRNQYPTIAVLTNMMATPFSEGIIFGAKDYAKQNNANILCFSGAEFAKPAETNMSRDRIFELINHHLIDGLILPMGALSRFISMDQQLEFLAQFSDLPVVTIASDIPGYQNVGYSAEQGMFQLIEHLVVDHQVQRFAFAAPTGEHLSSQVKQAFFEEALTAHGLNFDKKYYIQSEMARNAPIPALHKLFSANRKNWPGAIVVSTDYQAFSIISALKQMHIKVPEDVIVTGSMGKLNSLFSDPPLTSIVEPTYELGWHAAERVLAAINKNPYSESLVLPTSVAIRQSCGCQQPGDCSELYMQSSELSESNKPLDTPAKVQKYLELTINKISPELRMAFATDIAQTLTRLLFESIQSQQPKRLLSLFHHALNSTLKSDQFYIWAKLAQSIHQLLIEELALCTGQIKLTLADKLFHMVQACYEKASYYHQFETERYVGTLREIGIQLNSEFNLDEIANLLSNGLSINDCYVSVFEEMQGQQIQASNILAMRNNQRQSVATTPYLATQLLPPEIAAYEDPFALIVMPLSFKEEFLGYCMLTIDEHKGVVYEGLLTHLSSALKNVVHVRRLREAEKKFSDIAHSASDWLWEVDERGYFKYCSEGVKQVLGYAPKELIGRSIQDFLLDPPEQYLEQLMKSMAEQTNQGLHESRYQHKDGSQRILLTTGKPIIKFAQIVGYRGAYKDISEVKAQEARIRSLAYKDSLTQLPNRSLFNDRLNVMVSTAMRNKLEFSLLFIDLDGFKLINDSMGHDAGDQLLIEVAKLFKECLHHEDTLARFGGDEFVVILSNCKHGRYAAQIAQRLLDTLANPIRIWDEQVYITASIGISIYPNDGDTAEVLLKHADKAMYRSKHNGKNRFCFYEQELEDTLNRTVMIRHMLHDALREGGFTLNYQPQIDNQHNRVSGVEALIRLASPEQTFSPTEFIAVAEESGLIEQIGLWVFREACLQQKKWATQGYPLKCSINVSAKQLISPHLASAFISIIKEVGIDPNMLVIEITENAVIENESCASNTLQQLADYGLTIAIDDFGTGYASLSGLQKMPINILKIDRSFVMDCINNEDNASIISAIVMMAKALHIKIVAEGVETEEQHQLLSKLQCEEMQGYLFSKPLPAQQVLTFITEFNLKNKLTVNS